jgi:hypothetical protein
MDIVYGKNIHDFFHESIVTTLLRFDRCPKNDQRPGLLLAKYVQDISVHLTLTHISKIVVGIPKSSLLYIDGTRGIQKNKVDFLLEIWFLKLQRIFVL